MTISSRLLCTSAFIGLIHGVVWLGIAGSRPGKVDLPKKDLGAVPARLGSWLGEDVPVDSQVFAATGSESHLNRVYRNPAGEAITVCIEVFVNYVPDRGLDFHSPEVCYPAAGYRIVAKRDLEYSFDNGRKCSARMLTAEKATSSDFVLFWYQLGDRFFISKEEMRKLLWSMRGQDTWPLLVKVMLQTSGPDAQAARERFRELAVPLLASLEEYR